MQPINILVRSGQYCRQFTTKTFSIRNIITQIRRYNNNAQVVAIWYGDKEPFMTEGLFSNEEWREIPSSIHFDDNMSKSIPTTKEGLLKEYDYRTAVNMSYVIDCNNGTYPRLHPFKGVNRKGQLPKELAAYKNSHYPLFIADADNPYTNKEDVLLHLDGYRIERKVNGYDIQGYLIENNRYDTNEDAE